LSQIFQQGMTLLAWGVAIGLAGAMAAGEAIRSLLFVVSAFEVPTYLGVVLLLAAVSTLPGEYLLGERCGWIRCWPCVTNRNTSASIGTELPEVCPTKSIAKHQTIARGGDRGVH
jgi:hypothetical protein